MKPGLIFAVAMLAIIILMASFGSPFDSSVALNIPESMLGNVLYLCPAASNGWDTAAKILSPMTPIISIVFFFLVIILLFSWGWALYQNLLKDKFEEKAFKNAWSFTKVVFWAGIICMLVIHTPNYFRTVGLKNHPENYVLCESNAPGVMAVRQDAVVPRK